MLRAFFRPSPRFRAPFELIADFWISLFGLWALLHWASAFLFQVPFALLAELHGSLLVAAGVFALAGRFLGRKRDSVDARSTSFGVGTVGARGSWTGLSVLGLSSLGVIACVVFREPVSYPVVWLVLIGVVIGLYCKQLVGFLIHAWAPVPSSLAPVDLVLTLLVLVGVVLATGTTIRPDADDAFYVNLVAQALDQPQEALFISHRLLHLPGDPVAVHPSYKAAAYEAFAAALAANTGWDHLTVHYNVLPLFSAVVWVVGALLFFCAFGLRLPAAAVAVSFVVLLLWSGHHYAFGNFAFVRLFQGKTVVALVGAPLIFWAVSRTIRQPGWYSGSALLLAAAAVGSQSSTGLFVALAALGAAALVWLPLKPIAWGRLGVIFAAGVPVLLVLAVVFLEVRALPPLPAGHEGRMAVQGEAFGGQRRKILVLLLAAWLMVLPLYHPAGTRIDAVGRFALVAALIFLLPNFGWLVATLTGLPLLSWRIHWAFPTAMIPGLLVATLATMADGRVGERRTMLRFSMVGLVICGIFFVWLVPFMVSGPATKAFALHPIANLRAPKVPAGSMEEAQAVNAMLPEDAFVAASADRAEFLSRLRNPPQFTVLRHYLEAVNYALPEDAYRRRTALQSILDGMGPVVSDAEVGRLDEHWAAQAAKLLAVDAVIFAYPGDGASAEKVRFALALQDALESRGFSCTRTSSARTIVCSSTAGG